MKLLYTLTAYLPYVGGAQVHIHQIARRLAAAGASVRALAFWNENRADWLLGTTLRAPVDAQGYGLEGVSVGRLHVSLRQRAAMAPFVAAYYPLKPLAIPVLAHMIYPQVLAASEGAEIVHTARVGREPLSLASLWAARQREVPFCFTTLHHPKWMGAYDIPYHLLYRQADALFALTGAEREMLVRLGVRPERVVVVGHGTEVAPTADGKRFRAAQGIDGDGPLILFVAEKRSYKGFQQLVAAAPLVWRRHPDARFVFIGPRTEQSRRFFAEVADPRITELGTVDLQEKTDALAACTLLCVPSSQESFGGVYVEAWTQGKPAIGCRIPAVSEVIDDGENGLLVQQDPAQIADRIVYLLDNPAVARRLGAAGRAKAARLYSWERIVERVEQTYAAVLRGNL